jgi:hypothetical protein
VLKDIARQYEHWVTAQAKRWDAPIIEPPANRGRDDFVVLTSAEPSPTRSSPS